MFIDITTIKNPCILTYQFYAKLMSQNKSVILGISYLFLQFVGFIAKLLLVFQFMFLLKPDLIESLLLSSSIIMCFQCLKLT